MASTKPILLYSQLTPNGHKVTLALEELKAAGANVDYDLQLIDIEKNEQKEPWFLKINPNGRIPAITDRSRGNFNVFESAAILLYLQENYDKNSTFHFKENPDLQSEMLQWMFFTHGGIGPMQGQAHVFIHYAPTRIPFGIKRYVEEAKRLYSVLDGRLEGREYIVGDKYTWADMSTFPWIRAHEHAGISLDDYPNIKAWVNRINSRPITPKALRGGPADVEDITASKYSDPSVGKAVAENVRKYIAQANEELAQLNK